MKTQVLFLTMLLCLSIPQNHVFAQSDLIAAVYYNERPPIEHLKKRTQKLEHKKQPTQKKTPIIKKEQDLKVAGIALIVVGATIIVLAISAILVGLSSSILGGITMVVLGIVLGILGLIPFVLGLIFFGISKRKKSGK